MDATWQDVFKIVIMLFVAAAGAPFTQWVKLLLSKAFDTPVRDRIALIITGVVSAIFGVLEMWLSGVLNFSLLTLDNFPTAFMAVFTISTIYFAWLKDSKGFFGQRALLPPIE